MLARHAVRQFDSEKAGPATFTVARISTTQTYTPFSPQNLALSRAHPVSPSPLVLALVVPVCGQEAPRGGTVKNPRRSLTSRRGWRPCRLRDVVAKGFRRLQYYIIRGCVWLARSHLSCPFAGLSADRAGAGARPRVGRHRAGCWDCCRARGHRRGRRQGCCRRSPSV